MKNKQFIYPVLASTIISGCAALGFSDDFSVSGKITQAITVEKNVPVTIHCFCENRNIERNATENQLQLKIEGTHGSAGYHGEQVKPKSISPGLLRFVEKRANGRLVLQSREYTYMHNAYIVNSLDISAPHGIKIEIVPLRHEELEGRTVD